MDKTRVTLVLTHPKGEDTKPLIDATLRRIVNFVNIVSPSGWKASLVVEVKRKKNDEN